LIDHLISCFNYQLTNLNLFNLKLTQPVMKKILKYVGYLLIFLVVAIGALLAYVRAALPNVGDARDLKIEYTPERVARGKYLAT
jgi:hypothetical protein